MSGIKDKSIVRIIGDDKLWEVTCIINNKCSLKEVGGECYKIAKADLLILAD